MTGQTTKLDRLDIMPRIVRLFPLLVLLASANALGQTQPTVVKVGVLENRDPQQVRKQWIPTIEYLKVQIPTCTFQLVPLKWQPLLEAVAHDQLDFVITNPSQYIEMESRYGATRIATLKTQRNGVACDQFGAVIFTRADRPDIKLLQNLKGRSFAAPDEESFGGWLMAWREMKAFGLEPYRDFSKLQFAGSQDAVVFAVLNGRADAGTVRTDQLELMAAEGQIDLKNLRILNPQPSTRDNPFLRSTRLYPEWPIAAARNTPEDLARDVAVALLRLGPAHRASRAAEIAGWTIPLSYASVHDCLRELHRPPYEDYGHLALAQVISRYRYALLLAGLGTLLLLGTTLYVLRLNRNLNTLRTNLETELATRRQTEAQLIQAEKMEVVGRLAAGVAHEVKNPLAVILMGIDYLSLVIQSGGDEVHTVLKTMRHALGRADTIVRGLLDFSAPHELSLRCRDLNPLIEQSLLLAHHELSHSRITVERHLAADLPQLQLDDSKIEQVFVNLVINAAQAMPAGGTLTIRTRLLELTTPQGTERPPATECFSLGDRLVIAEVDDTGMGITPTQAKNIFDPFFTTKPPGKGTGLGLTVARSIIHLHQATIDLRNRPEGGVRVTLVFKAGATPTY